MRILIIDNRSQAGQGMNNLLDAWYQHRLIREAANVCEAVHLLKELLPHLILLDVRVPDWNGLPAIRSIKAKYSLITVIVLSLQPGLEAEVLASGAEAFISKSAPPEKLMEAITNGLPQINMNIGRPAQVQKGDYVHEKPPMIRKASLAA